MLLPRNAEVEPVTFITTMRLYLKIISCSRACAQLPIYRASLINVGTNVTRDLIHLWLLLVPTKMDLTCVVRRDIKLLSKRKCNFSDAVFHSSQSVDIFPDRELTASFTIAKNKEIGVQCQACDISALHVSLFSKLMNGSSNLIKYLILQINTECASTENRGVYHKEGGWPRDVNPHESDQTARYRKKIEKDEAYSHAVLNLGQVEFA